MTRQRARDKLLSLLAALVMLHVTGAAAQKTDTLHIRNGDRIIGEIKALKRGLLEYSTDDLQTIQVEWLSVRALVSPNEHEVESRSGLKYYGRLAPAPEGFLVVAGATRSDTLALERIVHLTPMDHRFVSRLDGYLDLGFSYQLAHHALQLSFGGEAEYRGPRAAISINGSAYLQNQDSVSATSRSSLSVAEQWFLPKRWGVGLAQSFEQNEELELENRFKLAAIGGRTTVQNDVIEWVNRAGIVVLREKYLGADAATTMEGVLSTSFNAFRYNRPKLDLATTLSIYPGISEWGRVRIDFDGRVRYELIKDFYLTLSVFERYDSRPPSATATKSDFGTTLSISWSF